MSTPQNPSDPQDPWDEHRRARAASSEQPPFAPPQPTPADPPPFAPPQPTPSDPPPFGPPGSNTSGRPGFAPPPAQDRPQPYNPTQGQAQPHAPAQGHPQPHVPHQGQAQPYTPAQGQPQPHVPHQAQPQPHARPAPYPQSSGGGGFVANPNLPLYDTHPPAGPHTYPPPHGGPGGPTGPGSLPPYGPGGPGGPAPTPPSSPMPLQPAPSDHHFVFGPPLDPNRVRARRDRPVLLRSALLALAVLAVAGVGAVRQAVKDGNDYANSGEHVAVSWALKEGRDGPKPPANAAKDARTLEGTWFQGDTVVRSERARVVAYRVDSGATVWEKPLPGGASMCAAGAETDGTIAVIVYGVGTACDRVAGVDVTSGTEVWSKPRTAKDTPAQERVAVSHGVAVSGDTAFRIRDGAQLWTANTVAAGCRVTGFRGGAALVANGQCAGADTVWALDPTTGKPVWTHTLPKGGPPGASPVVATSPVIVNEPTGTGGATRPTVLTDRGEPAFPIDTGNPLVGDAHGTAPRLLADEHTIYVPGNNGRSVHASSSPGANQIIAIDRASGRVRWISELPAAVKVVGLSVDSKAAPIAVEPDGALRVWVNARGSKPPRLVRFDPNDGHITVLDEYPLRLGVSLAEAMPKPFEHDGRLFLVDETTTGLGYRLIAGARRSS
ncbi:PQQ-binding-like beta-propeller repeat protein [Embleya sp. NPDC020630]|uniref:outer membrane protein assembly factor BamB family protein n=1 Tax=Embleya sp. NPDC020630 TaxID=3363979 RepID=UPI0037905378